MRWTSDGDKLSATSSLMQELGRTYTAVLGYGNWHTNYRRAGCSGVGVLGSRARDDVVLPSEGIQTMLTLHTSRIRKIGIEAFNHNLNATAKVITG